MPRNPLGNLPVRAGVRRLPFQVACTDSGLFCNKITVLGELRAPVSKALSFRHAFIPGVLQKLRFREPRNGDDKATSLSKACRLKGGSLAEQPVRVESGFARARIRLSLPIRGLRGFGPSNRILASWTGRSRPGSTLGWGSPQPLFYLRATLSKGGSER